VPWEISAHTAAAAEKEKLWKWTENTSGAMGSRRERLPSETKRREEEEKKQTKNKMAGSLALETSSKWTCFLSLFRLFFFLLFLFVLSVENRR
jgi:hypothetical protein